MNERIPKNQLDYVFYIPSIAAAIEQLVVAEDHLAKLGSSKSSDEELLYAEKDVSMAREALSGAITREALMQTIPYDDSIDLLRQFGFDCEAYIEADFETLLSSFSPGQAILLKKSHFYREDLTGTIASQPFVIPFKLLDKIRPAVVAEITVENESEFEIIPVRKSNRTETLLTPSVVVGEEAIRQYQTSKNG